MAYQPNIPAASDQLSKSQGDIQGNFQQLDTAFNLNHTPLESGNAGMHAFVEMPNQSASAPTTGSNEVVLYCNTDTLTSQPELFMIFQNGGASVPPPLNNVNGFSITSSNYIKNGGWTRLPSGILLKWGTWISGTGGTFTVTFPVDVLTIPAFQAIYNIQVTPTAVVSFTYTLQAIGSTTFQVVTSSTAPIINYFAIGI